MTYSTKFVRILLAVSVGLITTHAYANDYPEISFNTGRGTSVQITSRELVAPQGALQVCNEGGPVNYDGPCKADENCLTLMPGVLATQPSPGTITLNAQCAHAPGFAQWGANLNFDIIFKGKVVGSCTVGAFWNDTEQSDGPINFTDSTNKWGVFQPTECTNGFHINTVMAAGEAGEMGIEIILSSEFEIYDGGGFDVYACTYHQGDTDSYCSTDFTLWGESIVIDGGMQPEGGLKAGDTICMAEDTGRQIYNNYYFKLTEDASNFEIDGYPLEAYGTVFDPEYYVYPMYNNAISPMTANGQPSEISSTPCVDLPGKQIWVQSKGPLKNKVASPDKKVGP